MHDKTKFVRLAMHTEPEPAEAGASDMSVDESANTSSSAAARTSAAGTSTEENVLAEPGGSDVAGAGGSSSTLCESAQPTSEEAGEAAAADAPLARERLAASSSSSIASAAPAAAAGSSQLGLSGSHPTIPAPRKRVATTWHTDKLRPSRELMVYHLECKDEALLGTLELQPEHKLDDVLRMLRDELEVDAASVSRGTMGSSLKVPVHKNQYTKTALHFFPSKRHCLLVMEFDEGASD